MKKFLCLLALLALARVPAGAQTVRQVPEFMMVPKSTWTSTFTKIDQPDVSSEEFFGQSDPNLGFRLIRLKHSYQATKAASEALGRSGVIQSGDILLSFRPGWANTLAYAHVQLGVSHASLAFVVEVSGKTYIHSLESPLDYSSFLDSPHHYTDLDAFHIIRPGLSETEKANLKKWAKMTLDHPDRFEFFQDYGTPMYKRGLPGVAEPIDQVRRLATIIKGGGSGTFGCYCSEFVWSFLGLRTCAPEQFPGVTPKVFFDPLKGFDQLAPRAGLTQGPDTALRAAEDVNRLSILSSKVLVDIVDNPSDLQGRMSSGHQAVARANKPKMDLLKTYYSTGEPAAMEAAINQGVNENFSPTAFLVRSNAGLDGLKYVGTVVFDK